MDLDIMATLKEFIQSATTPLQNWIDTTFPGYGWLVVLGIAVAAGTMIESQVLSSKTMRIILIVLVYIFLKFFLGVG